MSKLTHDTKALFKDPDKRRAWVVFQLKLQGRSLASISRELGIRRENAQIALRRPFRRMEQHIANAVGVPVEVLFPERYLPDGTRHIRPGRPSKKRQTKDTRKRSSRNIDVAAKNRQGAA